MHYNFSSTTKFEILYIFRNNKNVYFAFVNFGQECVVSSNLLCRTCRGKCVLLELFEHASPRRKRSAPALFYFARRHEKRAVFIFQFSLPRSFYSGIRSNKHSPEADSRGEILEESSDVRELGGGGGRGERKHILNQLDRKAENRLADSHRRFPSSPPLISDRY